jgi:RNA polymerase sigma-70 factor (ECF subfamily)
MATPDLIAFRAGDEEAFRQLWTEHAPPLYRLAVRYVADRDAADDIVQEVLITAFERRATYSGQHPIGAWLRRICARRCLQALRRARGRVAGLPPPAEPAQDTDASEADRIANAIRRQELEDAVDNAIMALPPQQSLVAIRRFLLGRSINAIAAEMGLAPGTVMATLHQARRRIGQQLAPLLEID